MALRRPRIGVGEPKRGFAPVVSAPGNIVASEILYRLNLPKLRGNLGYNQMTVDQRIRPVWIANPDSGKKLLNILGPRDFSIAVNATEAESLITLYPEIVLAKKPEIQLMQITTSANTTLRDITVEGRVWQYSTVAVQGSGITRDWFNRLLSTDTLLLDFLGKTFPLTTDMILTFVNASLVAAESQTVRIAWWQEP